MERKEFRSESKRILELMINSVYKNRETFIRELISNASDAIDKAYYNSLTDKKINLNRDDFYIEIKIDKENRQLIISDNGIGMSKDELDNNLGTIAKSGSLDFKNDNSLDEKLNQEINIIGQFGVGFYSSFLVSKHVTVISKQYNSDKAFKWESNIHDGYQIHECQKENFGTDIILTLKDNTEDDNYDEYLDEFEITNLIKKYSDYISYPIKMLVTKSRKKSDDSEEYEEYTKIETINSMIPLWKRNKNEINLDEYNNFYQEKRFGFDTPIKHIHINKEGLINYKAIIYIPSTTPYDFYTKEYEKGLELYSNGVLIMDKCADLLPDYFNFVKGVVDSENLSLNISREVIQNDRQLSVISKSITGTIKNELENMLKNERNKYIEFFNAFGKTIKYGMYDKFGMNKDELKDLVIFYSSIKKEMITFKEYIENMGKEQKFIYYAIGDSIEKIDKLPKKDMVLDKGYDILYFTDEIDEFAIKVLNKYNDIQFKSIADSDIGFEIENNITEEDFKKNESIFEKMREILNGKVIKVVASNKLKNTLVCLSSDGEISIEMEKILKAMPNNEQVKANKILEININHPVFQKIININEADNKKFELYTKILYNQALMIEGLDVDPMEFVNDICEIM